MTALPKQVQEAWEKREGPAVFATVGENKNPNIIYVTCVSFFGDNKVVVADNYFSKTRKNIMLGSKGSLLFISKDNKAYQVKGKLEYHKSGELFDYMKSWNPQEHPGNAATVLLVEEVYSGADRLC